MSKYFTILFRDKDEKQSRRLTPDGRLTHLKIYAAMIPDKEKAEQVAQEIRTTHPGATVKVAPF